MMMLVQLAACCMMMASFPEAGDRTADPVATSRPSMETVQLPDRLKVVTFNVQNCSGGVDRLIEFLRRQEADLIFLQEVPRASGKGEDVASRIARALGNMNVVSAATLQIRAEQACDQAILSRFPLSDGRVHTLSEGGWVYAIQATIKGREGPLQLFSVHMHSTAYLDVDLIEPTGFSSAE